MKNGMTSGGKRSQLWVKVAISAGILLGLTLLIETITTYFFVYGKLIAAEAYLEAERQQAALVKQAGHIGIKDIHKLTPVVQELQRDAPRKVAWIRVLDFDANLLAEAGEPLVAAPNAARIHRQLETHQNYRGEMASPSGKILISMLRFRLNNFNRGGPPPERFLPPPSPLELPPGPPPREPGTFAEIAIYQDGVTIPFGDLRRNLIIGCMASLALLASMVLISILFTRFLHAKQLEQQIELARTVQNGLLPSSQSLATSTSGAEFAAVFIPAATIGGDFYDVFKGDQGSTSLVLGDVAGKGISAALLMGVLHGSIRSMDWTRSAAQHEASTVRLNQLLCERTARERFASLFWASFDPASGLLRYINAGHLPPLLVRRDITERLDGGGPVLGLLPSARFCCNETRVEAGDLLIVFSDGIAEAMNQQEEEFGEDRITEIARRHLQQHPRQICDAILSSIKEFLGTLKPHDDQTLLIVRLTPVNVASTAPLASQPERMPV